jgi:ferredoxin-nitrite reductase
LPLPLVTCPGLFYGSQAQDGILSRMRIPGGMLNLSQALAIADLIDQYGADYVQVTNRANLQIRGLAENINPDVFTHLQKLGIGSRLPELDPIRNIMISPTAGIDPQQLLDTRPLVQALMIISSRILNLRHYHLSLVSVLMVGNWFQYAIALMT